ncbi:DNA polymerase III subunit gamma/tau [Helicobacter bizzozeronii]|uniref:DNA polymerase III subunit gamma/tau n=1 Tax=Helicobacter bizzozeronii TaxID=56877 RepID=UPI000CF14458|nr:DNA polymerase III subunit gamma/tau [Helicobacter bizzozeronii]
MILALKYRPKHFKELIGQESVSTTLALALDRARLAHAYLFSGLRGSGKTSSARIFARALQCEKGPTSTPCDTCPNCLEALGDRHMDIIEIDGASNRRIEDVRNIIEQTKYQPILGRFKIFILDEVHMLTKEAFNALLKTLEEPPAHVKFILATTDVLKLPATILSRTQHFRFKKIPPKLIAQHLQHIATQENIPYEEGALEMIARSGGGSLRDTLTLLDQAINYSAGHLKTASVAQMLGMVDAQVLEDFFNALSSKQSAKLQTLLGLLEEHEISMVLEEMGLFLKACLLDQRFPTALLEKFLSTLAQAKQLVALGSDGGFVLTLSALKMQAYIQEHTQSPTQALMPQTPASTPTAQPTPSLDASALFAKLIANLRLSNPDLGETFERCIRFVSFKDQVLMWESRANQQDKEILGKYYKSLIVPQVQALYGQGVSIKPMKADALQKHNHCQEFMANHQPLMKAMTQHLSITGIEELEER